MDKKVDRVTNESLKNTSKKSEAKSLKSGVKHSDALRMSGKSQNTGVFQIILMIACAVLVFYPSFVRGLYFEDEQFPAQIISFILICGLFVHKSLKGEKSFLRMPLDYVFLSLVVVYGITTFVSVNYRSAISEFLKYCFYFVAYYLISELFRDYKHKLILLWTIIASTVGVCIIGIDGALGAVNDKTYGPLSEILNNILLGMGFKRSFFDVFIIGKIYSTLQYSNAFASFALAVFIVAVVILINSRDFTKRAISGGLASFIFCSMLFAQSRAVLIISLFVLALFVLFVQKGRRIKSIIYTVIPILSAVTLFKVNYGYVINTLGNEIKLWMIFIIGTLICGALCAGVGMLFDHFEKMRREKTSILGEEEEQISEPKVKRLVAIAVGTVATIVIIATALIATMTEPLVLEQVEGQGNSYSAVQKTVSLTPGIEYRLAVEVEAKALDTKTSAYSIRIFNKSVKDIVTDTASMIEAWEGAATSGKQIVEYNFKVPDNSKNMIVEFGNLYKDTKATFHNAEIFEQNSGAKIKKLKLKYKYIPDSVASRFENITTTKSFIERSIFYKDGLDLFKDRWILGAGGGAWNYLYPSKQSYLYYTTQAHNYFLQLGIETGIIGILIFLFMIFMIKVMFFTEWIIKRNEVMEEENRTLQSGLMSAMVGMILHSVFDFDFSLSAVFLLFCTLMALFAGRYDQKPSGEIITYKIGGLNTLLDWCRRIVYNGPKMTAPPLLLALVFGLLIILPAMLYGGIKNSDLGRDAAGTSASVAKRYLKSAISSDPFKAEYKNLYTELVLKSQSADQNDLEAITTMLSDAIIESRYSVEDLTKTGTNLFRIGDLKRSKEAFMRITDLRPRREGEWAGCLEVFYNACLFQIRDNEKDEALKTANEALDIPISVMIKNRTNIDPFKFESDTMQTIEMIDFFKNNPDKNEGMSSVIFYSLKNPVDANLDNIPDQWTVDGINTLKPQLKDGNLIFNNNIGVEAFVKTRTLAIEPEKNYLIEIIPNKNAINAEWSKSMPSELACTLEGIPEKLLLEYNDGAYRKVVNIPKDYALKTPSLLINIPVGQFEIERISVIRVKTE